jgi:hypothetical protein
LGVTAFALVTLLGLMGTLLKTSGEVTDHRDGTHAFDALHDYLNEGREFNAVYTWALDDSSKELVYVTYRVDSEGNPSASGKSAHAIWLDDFSVKADYESAREGRWIKVLLTLDDELTPVPKSELPPSEADYPHAYLVFRAEAYEVPDPGVNPASSPLFITSVAARR